MKPHAACLLIIGVSQSSWAANICDETVPSNRIIDGIPAYQQCADSTNAAIYSNNGIDTATSSGGSDWARTQGSGGYQCTELAHRYLYFRWNVRNVPNGNAGLWCDGTVPSGLERTTTPVHGDVMVFAPGSCGADQTTGHVAVVDVVNANATVTFIEQNRAGRRSCATNTAACFLHAVANNGTVVDGGAVDVPAPDSGSEISADVSTRSDRPVDNRRADLPGSGGAGSSGGAMGSGGAGGSGGTSAGQTASGGTTGTAAGGAPGAGGRMATDTTAVTSSGGSAGTSSTSEPSAPSDGGCSCRLAGGRSAGAGSTLVAFLALAAGLVILRRRRR